VTESLYCILELFTKLVPGRFDQLMYSCLKYDFIRKMEERRDLIFIPIDEILGYAAIIGPYCIDYDLALYSE